MTKATNRAIGAVVVVVAISAIAAYAAAPTSMPGPLVPIGISDVENLSTARILERSRILNRQREAITRRLKDIESELRNASIALNINGVGTPGRFNAKEMELSSLIRRQMELRERSSDLVTEINVLVTSSKEAGATTTSTRRSWPRTSRIPITTPPGRTTASSSSTRRARRASRRARC